LVLLYKKPFLFFYTKTLSFGHLATLPVTSVTPTTNTTEDYLFSFLYL